MLQEDLDARSTGIGGRAIAAIIGADPYVSRFDVWLELTGQKQPFGGNEATEWGNDIEPVIRRWYAKHKRPNDLVVGPLRTLRSTEEPWHLGSLDGAVVDPVKVANEMGDVVFHTGRAPARPAANTSVWGSLLDGQRLDGQLPVFDRALEIKWHGWRVGRKYGDDHTDQVPDGEIAQSTWYQPLIGTMVSDIAAVLGGERRIFTVGRDSKLLAVMLEAAREFWLKYVVPRVEPPPDGSMSRDQWIRDKFRTFDQVEVVATPEIESTVHELARVREAKRKAEAREKVLAQAVKDYLGRGRSMVLRGAPSDEGSGVIILAMSEEAQGRVGLREALTEAEHRLGMTDAEIAEFEDKYRGEPVRKLLPKVK